MSNLLWHIRKGETLEMHIIPVSQAELLPHEATIPEFWPAKASHREFGIKASKLLSSLLADG